MDNNLMLQKGFSNTDNKYVLFFKKRPIIKKNNDLNSKNNIEPIEKNNISTTQKLNQIILNLPNKKKFLRKKFLFDNNYQNDNFQTKIKDLIKKNQSIEKKQIIQKVERLDGIRESIKRLIQYKQRFAIDEIVVKLKVNENKKTPPLCKYNPNLDYISKHVPIPDLKGHNYINLIKIKRQGEKKQIKPINIYDDEEFLEGNYDINKNIKKNNKSNNNNIIPINSYNLKKINPKNINNTKFDNNSFNSNDSKICYSNNYKYKYNIISKSQSISIESSPLNHKRIKNHISVPIFKKMISRDRINNSFFNNHRYLADYFPNYNSIDSNANKYIYINKDLKNKKNKLRKIMSSSNTSGEYILLPILNK